MNRVLLATLVLLAATQTSAALGADTPRRPNIVWIIVDDMSPNFSCYGETTIQTPNVDRLASEGTRFAHAYVTAPVCSPCRSALITGCYQTTIGAQNHRSGRGTLKIKLPGEVVPVLDLFQKAGYYTCSGSPIVKPNAIGKTDYNFEWDPKLYNGNSWSGRKPDQPFFMQVQLHGGKYRGQKPNAAWRNRVLKELGSNTSPDAVKLPPYYPRDPINLQDWADYLDACRYTDKEVGDVVTKLKNDNLLDNTVLFFMTDHGISHARGKQFLYDEGTHVPLVIRGPGIQSGTVRSDLVEHIDLAATSLAIAGIPIPSWMQGKNILAQDYQPRSAVFAARDRCDETIEHIRSVRTSQFKYIRNYLPNRPMLQPCAYKDEKAILIRLRELHAAHKLEALQESLLFTPTRAPEELYDLADDPHELKNLASDPDHRATLETLRKTLVTWEQTTGDQGRETESSAMYDSDMDVYLKATKRDDKREELLRNIRLNKTWRQQESQTKSQ